MRKLLVGLLPVACTIASATPDAEKKPAAPRPVIASPGAPIIEYGNGCRQGQDIATDGYGVGGGRGGGVRKSDEGDYERAPSPKKKAPMADRAEPAPAPPPGTKGGVRPTMPRPPMQQPDGVKAGEWDDNANYRDYVKWLSGSQSQGRIDITGRQFVVVTDKDGKAVPNAKIQINAGQKSAQLTTTASGRALLFPTAFGLAGEMTATTTVNGQTVTAKIGRDVDGITKLVLPALRTLPAKRQIDLAFVLDTTGSMAEEIVAVKQTIKAVSDQLATNQTDVRIGLVEYKDRTDCLLTRTFPFSNDLRAFSTSIANVQASGGGDLPEDLHKGLDAALDKLSWRGDAVTRMVVVIADAPPHFYPQSRDYGDAARRAAARGIKLYTVAASGMDNLGQVVMRQMSQFTGASNMFVLRGGAGPQSVGGGDPKSSCGGTHQEFSSGKLDQLIMRKIRLELASLDADPMKIPGRGQDENAKPCDQRMVMAN